MKNNKKAILMTTMLLALILLGIGTIAYFRRIVNGNITGNTGNLVLIVNEADAVANESFEVILQRSEEENFIMPDDKGVFNLNIDSTGSSDDVEVTITISRTNLPENLRFYLDSNYNKELTTTTYIIEKSADMTKTVPVYWFWDGSISDEADSEFINKTISANISVSATIFIPFVETLYSKATLDTNVNFMYGPKSFINSEQCNFYDEQCGVNGEYCTELEQQCFEENGNGLMMMNSTQNDKYPILYYRGDVSDNNVIYAGYCWLIVRTTETGGTKLVFNGYVNSDGSCNNYSGVNGETINSDSLGASINRIQTAFNTSKNSPVYVGYMYNDTSTYWDSSTSTLDGDGYIAHLSNNAIDSTTGRHIQNLYDSNVKQVIDEWYEKRILNTDAEILLEDTVWCNDRSVISENNSIENYATNGWFDYSAYTRIIEPLWDDDSLTVTPNLTCTRDIDKFTVDSTNGNGDLDYSIGLLTADEIAMAGNVDWNTTYLTLSRYYWTMSPCGFTSSGLADLIYVSSEVGTMPVGNLSGIRPAISLRYDAKLQGGNGTFEEPYIFGEFFRVEQGR